MIHMKILNKNKKIIKNIKFNGKFINLILIKIQIILFE
jgi:hypothetical protein